MASASTFPDRKGSRAQRVALVQGLARRSLLTLCLGVLALSTVLPLIFLSVTSLRTPGDYGRGPLSLPSSVTLRNFESVWDSPFFANAAFNSLLVTSSSVLLLAVVSSMAAYALVHLVFPFRRLLSTAVVALVMLPGIILIIPIFKVMLDLGLVNQRAGLVLLYVALQLPFSTLLMSGFMRGVGGEVLDAAAIDGAGHFRTFTSIVIPLVWPGILSMMTLNFVVLWNDLIFSLLLLQEPSSRTLMPTLATLRGSQYDVNVPQISAGLIISIVPPLLVFLLFQRRLAEGLNAGSTK